MVRSTAFVPPMTGSPLAPLVVLFALIRSKVVPGARMRVLLPPALLAALMSATRALTLLAV